VDVFFLNTVYCSILYRLRDIATYW